MQDSVDNSGGWMVWQKREKDRSLLAKSKIQWSAWKLNSQVETVGGTSSRFRSL